MVRTMRALDLEARPSAALMEELRIWRRPLQAPGDLDPLLDRIGEARYVLLGEASHGTADYYAWRTAISQRLIRERGFSFIAVEADWPDCYRVNRFIKGFDEAGGTAHDVLHAFERWPTWMWANEEIVTLTEWLRGHNDGVAENERVGFYGLDVYSLWESLYAIIGYLRQHDASALPAARAAFACFEPYGEDVQEYARATRLFDASCEDQVVHLLRELREHAPIYQADGREAYFAAEQNALVLKNAEAYYRAMVRGGPDSWNVRDRHMAETLERLIDHHGHGAKAIVWEHNTHIGDARYTDMAEEGMVNIGQLTREAHGAAEVVLVGFGSYEGTVIAAKEWDAPMEKIAVPPAREGSWEEILHRSGEDNRLLIWDRARTARELLTPRGHRAIGVVYHPEYEHYGNYVPTVLPRRYDAFLFLDQTAALHPLHMPVRHGPEVPETFPSGV